MSSEKINTLTSFQTFEPMASRWLAWQCKMISEVKSGTVFIKSSHTDDTVEMLATWSGKTLGDMTAKSSQLALDAIESRKSIATKITCDVGSETIVCDSTTLPLRYNDKIIGAVVFLQSLRSEEQKKAVSQLFQWGCAWLESSLVAVQEEQNQLNPLITSLSKLALQDAPLALSAHEICNLLAQQLECKRVSLGIIQGLQIHTLALSHQLRFDKRASQIREMEMAMEEAVDQKQSIIYPKTDEMISSVQHKHQALSSSHDDASILSIPFSDGTDIIGSLLLLRPRQNPFSQQEINTLEYAIELLGSALALRLKEEHSFFKVLSQGITKKIKPVFGSEHWRLKLFALGLVVVLTTLSLFKTAYYTYATSSLEGAIQQVIVAPQDGFIDTAKVRAGDKVEAGQTMVSFNDQDLTLEHEKLLSERNKINKEYQEALVLRERSKVSIFSAQIAQVDTRLRLVEEKLKRNNVTAPFSGIVVSGDLSQSIGAPVEKGEQLFEIAPLGDYRVALNVDDHDVSKLKIGQTGSLRLMGLPYDQLPMSISRITPVASAKDGGNYFRVEATIADMNDTRLRPGMQGIAKVEVGEESVLWVWTHALMERLRLWLWSIGL